MNCVQTRLVKTILIILSCALSITAQELHPESLTREGADKPFWVSAASATSGGEMHWQALPAVSQRAIRQQMETQARSATHESTDDQPCTGYTSVRNCLPLTRIRWMRRLLRRLPSTLQGLFQSSKASMSLFLPR